MKIFKKQLVKSTFASLVILSLFLQFIPASQPAQAASILDRLGDWLGKLTSRLSIPNILLDEKGNIKLGTHDLASGLGKYTKPDGTIDYSNPFAHTTLSIGGKTAKSQKALVEPAVIPGCMEKFIDASCKDKPASEKIACEARIIELNDIPAECINPNKGALIIPKPFVPEQCEPKIPLESDEGALDENQVLAQKRACMYLSRLQNAASQEVLSANKIFNSTDPFTDCLFIRNCRSNCSLRLGEVSFTVTLLDVAALFVPGGFITIVQKILNIYKIINEVWKIISTLKELFDSGVSFINQIFNVMGQVSSLFESFANSGLKMSDVLIYGGGAVASYFGGGEIKKIGVEKGGNVGWVIEKGGELLQAGDGVVGGAAATMVFNKERASKASNSMQEMLASFAQNNLKFVTAKDEAIKFNLALKSDVENIRGVFKQEDPINFLFNPENARKKQLTQYLSDFSLIIQSVDAFLSEVSDATKLKDGRPIGDLVPGGGLIEWQNRIDAPGTKFICSQDTLELPLGGGFPPTGNPNLYNCFVPNMVQPKSSNWLEAFQDYGARTAYLKDYFALTDPDVIKKAIVGCDDLRCYKENQCIKPDNSDQHGDCSIVQEDSQDAAMECYGARDNCKIDITGDSGARWRVYWENLGKTVGSFDNLKTIYRNCASCEGDIGNLLIFLSGKPYASDLLGNISQRASLINEIIEHFPQNDARYKNLFEYYQSLDITMENRHDRLKKVLSLMYPPLGLLATLDVQINTLNEGWSSTRNRINSAIAYLKEKNKEEIDNPAYFGLNLVEQLADHLVLTTSQLNESTEVGDKLWSDFDFSTFNFPSPPYSYIENMIAGRDLTHGEAYEGEAAYEDWDEKVKVIEFNNPKFGDVRAALELGVSPEQPIVVYKIAKANNELEEIKKLAGKVGNIGNWNEIANKIIDTIIYGSPTASFPNANCSIQSCPMDPYITHQPDCYAKYNNDVLRNQCAGGIFQVNIYPNEKDYRNYANCCVDEDPDIEGNSCCATNTNCQEGYETNFNFYNDENYYNRCETCKTNCANAQCSTCTYDDGIVAPMYKCDPNIGQCVEDPTGGYATAAECNQTCTNPNQKYSCSGAPNYLCQPDDFGSYTSSNCNNDCGRRYDCFYGQCVEVFGFSNFIGDNTCGGTCSGQTIKYKCSGTSCVRDLSGESFITDPNCNNLCQAPVVPKYKCSDTTGLCERDDINGTYTFSDCDNACAVQVVPKYKCSDTTGACVRDDLAGTYLTSDCNNSCPNLGNPRYRCSQTTGACIRDDANGTYLWSDCDNQCVATVPRKYKCSSSGACLRDDVNGSYTTPNCDNQCVAPVTPMYKCSGSSCVRDDVLGTYNTSNCNYMCQGQTVPHYLCNTSTGTCSQSPSGNFTFLSDCNAYCGQFIQRRYSCSGNSCVENPNGQYTSSNCNNMCYVAPPAETCVQCGSAYCHPSCGFNCWFSMAECQADLPIGKSASPFAINIIGNVKKRLGSFVGGLFRAPKVFAAIVTQYCYPNCNESSTCNADKPSCDQEYKNNCSCDSSNNLNGYDNSCYFEKKYRESYQCFASHELIYRDGFTSYDIGKKAIDYFNSPTTRRDLGAALTATAENLQQVALDLSNAFEKLKEDWEAPLGPFPPENQESATALAQINKILALRRDSEDIINNKIPAIEAVINNVLISHKLITDFIKSAEDRGIAVPDALRQIAKRLYFQDPSTGEESGAIPMIQEVIDFAYEKVGPKGIGFSYRCSDNKCSAASGKETFLCRLKCFEVNNGKNFNELISFMDVLRNFENASFALAQVRETLPLVEPSLDMEPLQIKPSLSDEISEKAQCCMGDCPEESGNRCTYSTSYLNDKKEPVTKSGLSCAVWTKAKCKQQTTLFVGQAEGQSNFDTFKKGLLANPLNTLEDNFKVMRDYLDISSGLSVEKLLENAQNLMGQPALSGIDIRIEGKKKYSFRLQGLTEKARQLWEDLIWGNEISERTRLACDSVSQVLGGDPDYIARQCIERRAKDVNIDLLPLLAGGTNANHEALKNNCELLSRIDLDVLENLKNDPYYITNRINALEEQRGDAFPASGKVIRCPKYFCLNPETGTWGAGTNAVDPYCREVTELYCNQGNNSQGAIRCDGDNEGYTPFIVWDITLPRGQRHWPPDSNLSYQGAQNLCISTQQEIMDLKEMKEVIDSLVGGAGCPEGCRNAGEAIDYLINQCNKLEYQRSFAKDCYDFSILQKALGNEAAINENWKAWNLEETTTENEDINRVKGAVNGFCDIETEGKIIGADFSGVYKDYKEFKCGRTPLVNWKNIGVDFTLNTEEAVAARELASKICSQSSNDMRTPLNEVMKVFSVLLGVKSYTSAKNGLSTLYFDAQKMRQRVTDTIALIKNFPEKLKELWGSEDEISKITGDSVNVKPLMCIEGPMTSYAGGGEKALTGPNGGQVCPDVSEQFTQLDTMFSEVRQNFRMVDMARRRTSATFGIFNEKLKIEIPTPNDGDIDEDLNEVVKPLYDRAELIKEKAQLLWALATAIKFANENCTCGQSYCPMVGNVPFCVSGLPTTLAPLKQPFCHLVWTLRYPLGSLAERLKQDIESPFGE